MEGRDGGAQRVLCGLLREQNCMKLILAGFFIMLNILLFEKPLEINEVVGLVDILDCT